MSRRIYQILFFIAVLVFTALFAKEIKSGIILFPHIDKVAHFGIFFILAALLSHAFKAPIWVYVLILAAYGGAVEIMQDTLPHRQASLGDFIADTLGAISYFIVFMLWQKRAKKNA
ncbi:VanZ family protein [Pseudoalteromonas tunicata]|uniref:VanZ-like domain-containing protein n=1 Tax=Pseudoalteromonas tunicata D2 TaxID=87626 RepID=A4C7P2_9GAMM|nr:VanZ family protein [Pseudoalteromonas tunicata]ATC95967.1 hypothetical protein PTUN_a3682 [Pseudoalteromonas tunicata]AXT31503.1 hypothetical protein D1819_12160 [Pseudoalteromonas tunicata]EAR29996.1 hypothetical protein PTD2_14289 [Pseudoalteromonas tunicata D2]MDP4984540.1 VanZ family protein [Pseudoalteromonas tunicata]MDP5215340.1 VanZ family protein [Pseudoalteromonas tunicata]